jgi:hypothetical protein
VKWDGRSTYLKNIHLLPTYYGPGSVLEARCNGEFKYVFALSHETSSLVGEANITSNLTYNKSKIKFV